MDGSVSSKRFEEDIEIVRDEEGNLKSVVMHRKGDRPEELNKVDRGMVQVIIVLLGDILDELKDIRKTLKQLSNHDSVSQRRPA